jgi:hypothetical protein
MGRTLVGSLLLYGVISAPAYSAPAVVVAKTPSLVCPQTELGDAVQQARYGMMWKEYSEKVDEASIKLQGEIEKQTKTATGSGNLDLALFWKALSKEFEQKGELRWDEPSLKKTWSDRFGDSSFPDEFGVAVKKASEAYASARKDLEKGYGELVTKFTKAEKLEEALKVRGELKELLAEKATPPEPAPAPAPAPAPKPKSIQETTKTIDLLKGLDLRGKDGWRRDHDRLVGQSGKLIIPVPIQGDYDLTMEFSVRNSQDGSAMVGIGLTLPLVKGMPKTFYQTKPDGSSMTGYFVGAEVQGDKPPPLVKNYPEPLTQNKPHTAIIRVRDGCSSVAVLLDGTELLQAKHFPNLPNTKALTVAGWSTGTEITIRSLTISELPR